MRCIENRSRSDSTPTSRSPSTTQMCWMPASAIRIAASKAKAVRGRVTGSGVITPLIGPSSGFSPRTTRFITSLSVKMPTGRPSGSTMTIDPIRCAPISSTTARIVVSGVAVIGGRMCFSDSRTSSELSPPSVWTAFA